MENTNSQKMYFNRCLFSDINPYEVVKKISDKCYLVRSMSIKLMNKEELNKSFVPGGFLGHIDNSLQTWGITSNQDGHQFKVRLHKNGEWKDSDGMTYTLSDKPIKYYDFNF